MNDLAILAGFFLLPMVVGAVGLLGEKAGWW